MGCSLPLSLACSYWLTPTHPLSTQTHTNCLRTHTFPVPVAAGGESNCGATPCVYLGAGRSVKGALQGEEQPARTGLFLLVWVWAAEKAVQGGRVEENRPLSTRSQTSGCKTLVVAGGDGGEKVPHPVFARGQCKGVQNGPGPQLPTLERWEGRERAVASLEDGVGAGAHHDLDAWGPRPLRQTPQ